MSAPLSCTGSCCAKFYLTYSKEIIKREAQQGVIHNSTAKEMRTIADMVIPLDGGRSVGTRHVGKKKFRFFTYTCRHWNPETKLCGNYANRPVICRTHPPAEALNGTGGCGLDKTGTCTLTTATPYQQAVEDFKAGRP